MRLLEQARAQALCHASTRVTCLLALAGVAACAGAPETALDLEVRYGQPPTTLEVSGEVVGGASLGPSRVSLRAQDAPPHGVHDVVILLDPALGGEALRIEVHGLGPAGAVMATGSTSVDVRAGERVSAWLWLRSPGADSSTQPSASLDGGAAGGAGAGEGGSLPVPSDPDGSSGTDASGPSIDDGGADGGRGAPEAGHDAPDAATGAATDAGRAPGPDDDASDASVASDSGPEISGPSDADAEPMPPDDSEGANDGGGTEGSDAGGDGGDAGGGDAEDDEDDAEDGEDDDDRDDDERDGGADGPPGDRPCELVCGDDEDGLSCVLDRIFGCLS